MIRIIITFSLLICAATLLAGEADAESAWLRGIPLHSAIRIGTGKHVVIEVSDPDCRFSRRMASYWNMRTDVTRYIFLVAMKNHPEAAQKGRYILSSADRAAAYQEVFSGGLDFNGKALDRHYDDKGVLDQHRDVAARLGVIGTPTYFIEGVKVNGAKVGEIEQILGGNKIPFEVDDSE